MDQHSGVLTGWSIFYLRVGDQEVGAWQVARRNWLSSIYVASLNDANGYGVCTVACAAGTVLTGFVTL